MKKNNKKLKVSKYESNDTKEIKSLIIIIIIVVCITGGLYLLTLFSESKKSESNTEITYDTCLVGNMFNMPGDEYYVFLYSSLDSNASSYRGLITSYGEKDDSLTVYRVDLNDSFNKKFVGDSSFISDNLDEFMVKDSALLLIKNGKVSKFYETLDEYKNVLE